MSTTSFPLVKIDGNYSFFIIESTTATERVVVFTLKANEEFDYETQDTYKIRATANDSHNSVTVLLTIQVEDVGETPYMNPNTSSQYFSIEENAVCNNPKFE